MSTKTEQAIQITAKFLDARDTLKRLNDAATYEQKIKQYQDYIRQGMAKWDVGELMSAMKLLQAVKDSPFTMLGIMAALVEMQETP